MLKVVYIAQVTERRPIWNANSSDCHAVRVFLSSLYLLQFAGSRAIRNSNISGCHVVRVLGVYLLQSTQRRSNSSSKKKSVFYVPRVLKAMYLLYPARRNPISNANSSDRHVFWCWTVNTFLSTTKEAQPATLTVPTDMVLGVGRCISSSFRWKKANQKC